MAMGANHCIYFLSWSKPTRFITWLIKFIFTWKNAKNQVILNLLWSHAVLQRKRNHVNRKETVSKRCRWKPDEIDNLSLIWDCCWSEDEQNNFPPCPTSMNNWKWKLQARKIKACTAKYYKRIYNFYYLRKYFFMIIHYFMILYLCT